jgi:hypothetical protein
MSALSRMRQDLGQCYAQALSQAQPTVKFLKTPFEVKLNAWKRLACQVLLGAHTVHSVLVWGLLVQQWPAVPYQ